MSTQLRGESASEVRRMGLGVKKLSTKLAIFGVVLSTTRNQNVPYKCVEGTFGRIFVN